MEDRLVLGISLHLWLISRTLSLFLRIAEGEAAQERLACTFVRLRRRIARKRKLPLLSSPQAKREMRSRVC